MTAVRQLMLMLALGLLAFPLSAMQPLDDSNMSNVVARDDNLEDLEGLTFDLNIDVEVDLAIEDVDGVDGPAGPMAPNAGMIYVPGLAIQGLITVNIQAAKNVKNEDVLAISATVPPISLPRLRVYNHGSGLGNARDPDYEFRRNDVDDTVQRVDDMALILNPNNAILDIGSLETDSLFLVIHLGTDLDNLLKVVVADVFDVRIKDFIWREMAGNGAVTVDEILVRGVDLTGVSMSVTEDGKMMLSSPEMNANVAVTGLSFANRQGEAQSVLGNLMLRNLNADRTRIQVVPR